MGNKGKDVRHLQYVLGKYSFYPGLASSVFDQKTSQAVKAFQKYKGLTSDGIVGKQTFKKLQYINRPVANIKKGKHIEINLKKQLVFLVNGGKVQRTINVSTGRPGYETPKGSFRVYRKEKMSWSKPYNTWMPLSSYFVGGVALHEGDPEVMSHACIHVPPVFSQSVYQYASIGTKVVVY